MAQKTRRLIHGKEGLPPIDAPPAIHELVERFRNNQRDYNASTYKEFQLRKEFVDPFFECLGWDTSNKGGYAEAYKDVIHEDSIRIAGGSKAPDYAFRVGGTRKFFVETKSPSVNIREDAAPAFQLRRYGWSAKLPLSLLTDFQEIAVYDCRVKPNKDDKASTARVLLLTYDEYLTRWNEIASVFSREAILKGSFDRFAEDATRKRGTAEVDTAFLAEIEQWRSALARNIALRNARLSVRELNTAVQRTIDRIIFLRIAEDRGIEPYARLRQLAKGNDVYKRLGHLFRQADDRYNSGLFHFRAQSGSAETPDTFTLGLSIDDRVLREIFAGLYYPESPYAFAVLPADILGQVYEQFLGKVIRLSGRSAVVDEKPEVKKAGGVFYTPTFVVQYIVKKVLDPLLEGKSPTQISGADKRAKQATPLRILDPACGSGSFLIEAYQQLLDWYRDWYARDGAARYAKGKAPKLYKAGNGEWRLTIAEKRRILLTHIYGVDIDLQAVEVTKLSLLLKVLENEKADIIAAQMNFFHIRALPDLGGNVKCGNSLVSHDFYGLKQGSLFSEDERIKINAFDWSNEFKFRFDAIIGNPPYGADYTSAEKSYFQSKYSYRRGKPETYLFFLEQGLQLLKANGLLGFILPNAWLTNFYGLQVRGHVLRSSSIVEMADLEPVKVFKAATVDTCVIVLRNVRPDDATDIAVSRVGFDRAIRPEFTVKQRTWAADPERIYNVYASESDLSIMKTMEKSTRTLTTVVDFSQGVIPYKTKADGKKNLYIASQRKNAAWKPLLESASQVEQYQLRRPETYVHYGRWLWCAREPKYFDEAKILFHRLRKKLPRQLIGAIDTEGAVNRHSLSNLILQPNRQGDELWAVLALFNSDLVNWWFVKRYGPLMEVGGFKVQTIPLPDAWAKSWPSLANKAKRITELLRSAEAAKDEHSRAVQEREAQSHRRDIEKLVADSYGISAQDIVHTLTSFQSLAERARRESLPIVDEEAATS